MIQVIDLNKDGKKDILFSTSLNGKIFFSENIGTEPHPLPAKPVELLRTDGSSIGGNYDVYHFCVEDFNGDGIYDIVDADAKLFLGTVSTAIEFSLGSHTTSAAGIKPNLQQHCFTIFLNQPRACYLEIFSLRGQKLYSRHYGILTEGTHAIRLPMATLSGGQYLIRMQDGEKPFFLQNVVEQP